MSNALAEVRDPLHGAIPVSKDELSIVDQPLFQRLRYVKQLGFSDLSFPGATHTRYLHSIGAMHLAGIAFDSIFGRPGMVELAPRDRRRLRRLVRAAALLHDIGHAPFSHASEFAMPSVGSLAVPAYSENPALYPPNIQATHEDYTIKLLTDSALTPVLESVVGMPARAVAGLVDAGLPTDPAWYTAAGIDWHPLLQQLISSELDVDRMDYLARDSHFSGVHYGVFDVGWLMNHLRAHFVAGRAHLALDSRAIYAFDDFLIARYHMFLMVYFHYRSVAYEEMLKRYLSDGGDGYRIPSDINEYEGVDDNHLTSHLRASSNQWARRIVERREYKLLLERHGEGSHVDLSPVVRRLKEASIPHFTAASTGVLSKYFAHRQRIDESQEPLPLRSAPGSVVPRPGTPPLYTLEQPYRGARDWRAKPVEHSTALFDRFQDDLNMVRVYVPPEHVAEAGEAVHDVV